MPILDKKQTFPEIFGLVYFRIIRKKRDLDRSYLSTKHTFETMLKNHFYLIESVFLKRGFKSVFCRLIGPNMNLLPLHSRNY